MLLASKVPLKQIDGYAIAEAVRAICAQEECDRIIASGATGVTTRLEAMRLQSARSKDLDRWLDKLGASPSSRARIGLKPAPEKKVSALAELIAAKQGKRGS
jgi:hypothetical protein